MHFDAVLSEFIHPCSKKRRRAQYSRGVDTAVCVRALQMCVCAIQMCVCAIQMCVCAIQMCVCAIQMCVCAIQMCVCAIQMCVRAPQMCVSVRAPVHGKLLTQRSTSTIPNVFYARLMLSCSAYIES